MVLNTPQRIVLIVFAICFLFISIFYVPFVAQYKDYQIRYYAPLWASSPEDRWHKGPLSDRDFQIFKLTERNLWKVRINTSVWFIEFMSLVFLVGVITALLKNKTNDPQMS